MNDLRKVPRRLAWANALTLIYGWVALAMGVATVVSAFLVGLDTAVVCFAVSAMAAIGGIVFADDALRCEAILKHPNGLRCQHCRSRVHSSEDHANIKNWCELHNTFHPHREWTRKCIYESPPSALEKAMAETEAAPARPPADRQVARLDLKLGPLKIRIVTGKGVDRGGVP